MNMDNQDPQPPTYTAHLAFDPPPPYIPPHVQAIEPSRDCKGVLVDQMDRWLEELDDIDWTVRNAQPVPEYLPRHPGTDGTDQDRDSDLDGPTLGHEPGNSFSPDDKVRHDLIRSHDTGPVENENEHYNNDTSVSEDISDDDGCDEELSAIVNSGWARLRRIQDHIASFKHSLSEDSECYNTVL